MKRLRDDADCVLSGTGAPAWRRGERMGV